MAGSHPIMSAASLPPDGGICIAQSTQAGSPSVNRIVWTSLDLFARSSESGQASIKNATSMTEMIKTIEHHLN